MEIPPVTHNVNKTHSCSGAGDDVNGCIPEEGLSQPRAHPRLHVAVPILAWHATVTAAHIQNSVRAESLTFRDIKTPDAVQVPINRPVKRTMEPEAMEYYAPTKKEAAQMHKVRCGKQTQHAKVFFFM